LWDQKSTPLHIEIKMEVIVIDYETFYSKDYSLRKMTPVEYVLDPRFECIGAAVKRGLDAPSVWIDGPDLQEFFDDLDPNVTCLVSHNALFDMCITAWVYDFVPRLMVDTLGLARATLAHKLKSLSLASVAAELGAGIKGGTVHKVIGMSGAAIKASGLYQEYTEYAKNDADLCAIIYRELVINQRFPASELVVMDTVLRCAIQPQFRLDQSKLALHLNTVRSEKQALMDRIGFTKEELLSNDKFAIALSSLGVTPPRKTSLATGKETWAFARTDPEFIALDEHPNPDVQALVAARLGIKSTLEETRTERFLSIANLTWPGNEQRLMPMPLRYSGAHTHRLSGDWNLNVQNMPRGGALRAALVAPAEHKVVAADASQIEARIVAWLSGAKELVQAFRDGEDVYSSFASKVFQKPINKKDHPDERFIGKTAILGLGYGMGWAKFQKTIELQSGGRIKLTDKEAADIVSTYRSAYPAIPHMWTKLNSMIEVLVSGVSNGNTIHPLEFSHQQILLPSGLSLRYHDIEYNADGQAVFTYQGKPKYLWGGKLLENITQALARIIVMDAAIRLRKLFASDGIQLALQVHDELVYVVPTTKADTVLELALEFMRTPPLWATSLPLDAEGSYGQTYGDAK
jgi:hypothetical protein